MTAVLKHEELRQAATGERLTEIQNRAGRVELALDALRAWIENQPTPVFETPESEKLMTATASAARAVRQLSAIIGRGEDVEQVLHWTDASLMKLSRCLALLDPFLAVAKKERNFMRMVKISDRATINIAPAYALQGAVVGFTNDAQWLARVLQERVFPAVSSIPKAERMRRMRARRKAGFRIASVAVHDNDIALLQRLGMLGKDFDQADLDEAMTTFMAIAMTAANSEARPRIPNLEESARVNDPVHFGLFPELRADPLVAWVDRMRRLVEASL